MIIGNDFVWAHNGKTGGDSVRCMFDIIGGYVFAHDTKDPQKHIMFSQAQQHTGIEISGKKRIMNFRRLRPFLVSYIEFKKREFAVPRGMVLDGYIRNRICGRMVDTKIDDLLIAYEYDRIGYWLRTERLADDFIATMRRFISISKEQETAIRNVHANKGHYDKSKSYFSEKEIKHIYQQCPIWAGIEKQLWL